MATSSIFADFSIYDKEKAEAFVDALDRSANGPKWEPKGPVSRTVTDPAEIRAIAKQILEKNA